MGKDTSKNTNFHFKPSSEELMTKFHNRFKKTYFWLIFGTFSPFFKENNIFKNRALSHAILGPLPPCWKPEKTNEPISKTLLD